MDRRVGELVGLAGAWAIVLAVLAASFVVDPDGPPEPENVSAAPVTDAQPEIEMVRTVHDSGKLEALAASGEYLNVIAPLSLVPTVQPVWMQFSPDLNAVYQQAGFPHLSGGYPWVRIFG